MKKSDNSTKIQLSIASLMFFAPFIKSRLNKSENELNQDEKNFVQSFISLGWINIIVLWITAIVGLSAYYNPSDFLITSYQILIWILVFMIIGWSIAAIAEYPINLKSKTNSKLGKSDKINLLLYYIPGYSIYLRYNQHKFDDPNIYLKESMILWALFTVFSFLAYDIPIIIIAIIIVVRVVMLIGGLDIIPQKTKEKISKLFYKNPEEIWAYVRWSVLFIFQNNYTKEWWKSLVNKHKKEYQYIYDIKKTRTIQVQYWIWFIIMIIILWQIDLGRIPALWMLGVALFLSRYLTMIFIRNRAPSLPIIHEIQSLISKIAKTLKLKK